MSDGSTFRMPALHLVTKELREWLWITIWWSPDPDGDFGADRPEAIVKLGGPWKNYKMAVVTAYEEKDPDPRGGFTGSLGDALAATYQGVGKPTWTSNQYIERGAHNAQTNCIGCHQHAGTTLSSESILADQTTFPEAGRTKVRKNFPTDYMFAAMSAPESLAQAIQAKVAHYDTIDR
jgi:mono/diheme cytochrome c family protein